MIGVRCMVAGCTHVACGLLPCQVGPFAVCALHDVEQVRGILDRGQLPQAAQDAAEHPTVVPAGPLLRAHRSCLEPLDQSGSAGEGLKRLRALRASQSRSQTMAQFDLTKDYETTLTSRQRYRRRAE